MDKAEKKIILLMKEEDLSGFPLASLDKLNEFSVIPLGSLEDALSEIQKNNVAAVLIDNQLPVSSGTDIIEHIHKVNPQLPLILMTDDSDFNLLFSAVKKGSFDYLIKPFTLNQLILVITKAVKHYFLLKFKDNYNNYLEDVIREKTGTLEATIKQSDFLTNELLEFTTKVIDFKEATRKAHVTRIGKYTTALSGAIGLPAADEHLLSLASPFHDIGKLGIPEHILLKPEALSADEYEIIKTHTIIGEKILCGTSHPALQTAASIALHHHENCDGSGYPQGLKGEEIPLESRIMRVADHYDVLRSKRPYKREFTHDETFNIMTKGSRGTKPEHFDPDILNAFIGMSSKFDEIYRSYRE